MSIISAENIYKSFDGKTYVLQNISFEIGVGEVFGFLGPNGAGKTTTVRILNGILTADKGSCRIHGRDIKKELKEVNSICGVMTETANCYEQLTGEENLIFFGQLYGMTKGDSEKRAAEVMHLFDIYDNRNKKFGDYSSGMKKKLQLARAFLHNPKVLFLDEPTSGLDPEAAKNVNELIKKTAVENNVTVFLCTHQLKYAEEICTLYGFIDEGKIIGFGTFDELIKEKKNSIHLEIRGENIPVQLGFDKEFDKYKIMIDSDRDAAELIKAVLNQGGTIYEAKQLKWGLEDLYFAYQKN